MHGVITLPYLDTAKRLCPNNNSNNSPCIYTDTGCLTFGAYLEVLAVSDTQRDILCLYVS